VTIKCIPFYASELNPEDFAWVEEGVQSCTAEYERIPEFSNFQNVDVLVEAGDPKSWVIIDGRTANTTRIEISLRRSDSFSKKENRESLPRVFHHEAHHIVRKRGPSGYGFSLGEILVSEGLAQVFELEMTNTASAYSLCLDKGELLRLSERARTVITNDEYFNSYHWLMGTELAKNPPEHFERWSAYGLGFALVSSWFLNNNKEDNHPYATAAKAVQAPASEVLELWLDQKEDFLKPWLKEKFPALKASIGQSTKTAASI
jgi:uncharacterized protein YjaZ